MSWFAHREDGWEAESERTLKQLDIPTERWSVEEAAQRFPSFDGSDLAWVLHEPEAGVLRAQKAIQTLVAQAQARGAQLVHGHATPDGAYAVRQRRRPRGRSRRLELRRLAAPALPRPRPAAGHPAGALLLRRRPGLAQLTRLGRLRPRDLRHARHRRARGEDRVGPRRPADRTRRRPPAGRPRRPSRWPAATSPTASPRWRRRRSPGAEPAATS